MKLLVYHESEGTRMGTRFSFFLWLGEEFDCLKHEGRTWLWVFPRIDLWTWWQFNEASGPTIWRNTLGNTIYLFFMTSRSICCKSKAWRKDLVVSVSKDTIMSLMIILRDLCIMNLKKHSVEPDLDFCMASWSICCESEAWREDMVVGVFMDRFMSLMAVVWGLFTDSLKKWSWEPDLPFLWPRELFVVSRKCLWEVEF